ncbi:putative GNAT superfamily acetyltransferase [Spelaeicoccus albus]|uniref:Putative GNAT superfamily acetyltransferase n=2 Tax=Spelaeicoccus albus TaxID=1280376 RepID=A0A7Z0AA83_9MICO|nr:putative GNAT superfamily acetyltransferase [Spelaeicoccus albus]
MHAPGDDAAAEAREAADSAGVVVRALDTATPMAPVSRMLSAVWNLGPNETHVPAELMTAMAHTGNYLSAAYRDGEPVGGCIGFFAEPLGRRLHSHIAGVVPRLAGRGIGRALKLHQRAWCLARGIDEVSWTFDPLVARNAYFDIARLGARPAEYLTDFYGSLDDVFNAGQPTDRLLLVWDLHAASATAAAARPAPADAPAVLRISDGEPDVRLECGEGADVVTAAIPPDIDAVRAADPARAGRWRLALRHVLTSLLESGRHVQGFDKSGFYLVGEG